MNPEITIVIPYHNEEKTIEYTLLQIGLQALTAKTAIFINSSSTDNTYQVVDNWIKKNQSCFTTKFKNIFENTNNPACSKNVGIRYAETEWVAFMDCGQNFEVTWLQDQYNLAQKEKVDVVSGVVCLVGENWVDRCAVAQTYGYKRNRPCVPTTLVKKSVFEKTGLFLAGRRAGYDVAWPLKLKKLGIKREINEYVKICYMGSNFSSNLKHLFKKSRLYAKPTVAIEGYHVPYLYLVMPLILLVTLSISFELTLGLFIIYFFIRSFFTPIMKSRNLLLYKEYPLASILGLGIVGLIIDIGKFVGILDGFQAIYLDGA